MIEFALFRDGAFVETRYFEARPADIPHKAVAWHPVRREVSADPTGFDGDVYVIRTPAPAPRPRETHTAWLRLALIEARALEAVEAEVDAKGAAARALWDYATTIRETDPEVVAIGAKLSLDLPALFDRAEAIRRARGL